MIIPAGALSTVLLIIRLAPPVRDAVAAIVRALQAGDEKAAREATEAALRAAFIARQRR